MYAHVRIGHVKEKAHKLCLSLFFFTNLEALKDNCTGYARSFLRDDT